MDKYNQIATADSISNINNYNYIQWRMSDKAFGYNELTISYGVNSVYILCS